MKIKIISIVSIMLCLITIMSCGKKDKTSLFTEKNITRAVSDLAVIDCYYHSMVKIHRPKDGTFKKDTTYWLDFTSEVKLGIDAAELVIEPTIISETEGSVVIKLPPVKLLDNPHILYETINYISSEESRNSVKITAEEQTEAVEKGKEKIKNELMQDSGLKKTAENRVKDILEAYIKKLGEIDGKTYTIKWEKLEESPSLNTEVLTESSETAS